MSALDTLLNIVNNENLMAHPFKYCLVSEDKLPYRIDNKLAHPNKGEDFYTLEELVKSNFLNYYAGIGISIIESNISAIDIDKCFSVPFDVTSGDERAQYALNLLKDSAYIEFSFSGKGLRILFKVDNIPNYTEKYYIKNDKTKIEYYQPGNTPRYVTITGRYIYNNSLYKMSDLTLIYEFLNKYMIRPVINVKTTSTCDTKEEKTLDELLKSVRGLYLRDIEFQNLWFMSEEEHFTILKCHIQGESKESHADFRLLSILYANITKNKEKLRLIFEASPYFQSKDAKHLYKWNYNNYRYYNYIYERL